LALVAFVGVLLVPAALGVTRPDDKAGQLGVGAVVVATEATSPNDAAGALGVGRVALETRPAFWQGERDLGLYTPAGDVAVPAVVPVALAEPSGTNWGGITLVAAGVVLLLLLAGGMAMRMEHRGPFRPVPH
jgi:hypothetical protein